MTLGSPVHRAGICATRVGISIAAVELPNFNGKTSYTTLAQTCENVGLQVATLSAIGLFARLS